MDTGTCSTIVLVLLWLCLCCQAVGFLVGMIKTFVNSVVPTSTTLSTLLLGLCLWQCKKAGYLVSPMTWYHWALLVLLVLLQVMVVIFEDQGWGLLVESSITSTYVIYGIAVVLVVILGGSLFCGWKCNLFCRPCCKSQYICYGSAVVVVLVVLIVLAITAQLPKNNLDEESSMDVQLDPEEGDTGMQTIAYLDKMLLPITQCYATAVLWNTTLILPYKVPEVVVLVSSAVTVASLLASAVPGIKEHHSPVLSGTITYPLLSLHLISLVITLYCLEYKSVFHWPKDYMCFGLLATVVILVALVAIVIVIQMANNTEITVENDGVTYTLLGYSFLLMVPVFWYAYRCGLLTWRWNSCLPKKKGLEATDTAENTVPDSDIAKE